MADGDKQMTEQDASLPYTQAYEVIGMALKECVGSCRSWG